MATKKSLNRGLDDLMTDNAYDEKSTVELSIAEIEPNLRQPRKDFDDEALRELADSIEKHGLLQPIVVRPLISGGYEIVAGERRWRACRMIGMTRVPVVIRQLTEQNAAEIAMVENLQREDLNPYEEALGYEALTKEFHMTQEEVANRVGKSRVAVTNALRLLKLPADILEALRKNDISAGHARAMLAAPDEEIRQKMFSAAMMGASVRELERMSKQKLPKKAETSRPFYTEVALSLKNELHRKVVVKSTGKNRGVLTLEFYSDEELQDFAARLAEKRN